MPFVRMPDDRLIDLKELIKNDNVKFDWSLKSSSKSVTIAFVNDGLIAGLVEFQRERGTNKMWLIEVTKKFRGTTVAGKLLAYVGKDSLECGNEGFFFFEPKDALRAYYMKKFGAKEARGRNLFFDTEATQALIDEYLSDDDFKEALL